MINCIIAAVALADGASITTVNAADFLFLKPLYCSCRKIYPVS